jgi:hypothetical protein
MVSSLSHSVGRQWLVALLAAAALGFGGCQDSSGTVYSGRVESIYYTEYDNSLQGYTRFDKGLPGASTRVKVDVWVDVRADWVTIHLKGRSEYTVLVPKERVRVITVGSKETNELNIPKA